MSETANGSDSTTLETTTPDAELVGRVRAGDEAAFEELFNRHRRRVAFIVNRFFKRREQIEDVIQETFVKAFFALESFDGTHDKSFPAWLARIATNAAYDELRRTGRRRESDLSEEETAHLEANLRAEGEDGDIEDALISRDLAHKLLARLSPDDRLVLTLLNGEEATVAEVAEMTGWSIAKVKVRAHRARASLRAALHRFL